MGAVVPRHRLAVDQAEVGFVDERRCLEAMALALPGHAASREAMELPDERPGSIVRGRPRSPWAHLMSSAVTFVGCSVMPNSRRPSGSRGCFSAS